MTLSQSHALSTRARYSQNHDAFGTGGTLTNSSGDRPTRDRDPVEVAARRWGDRYPETERFRALTALVRTYGVALRSIEQILRPVGLNLSRFELLLVLSFTRAGALPMMRLRDILMMHGSSVTYLVNRLVEAHLVERSDDPSDRRVSLVGITPAGRDVVERAANLLVQDGFGIFGQMDEDRLERLADWLSELRQETSTPPHQNAASG